MNIMILEAPKYRKGSTRAKWFAPNKRYDGKDADAIIAATAKKPPVVQ